MMNDQLKELKVRDTFKLMLITIEYNFFQH